MVERVTLNVVLFHFLAGRLDFRIRSRQKVPLQNDGNRLQHTRCLVTFFSHRIALFNLYFLLHGSIICNPEFRLPITVAGTEKQTLSMPMKDMTRGLGQAGTPSGRKEPFSSETRALTMETFAGKGFGLTANPVSKRRSRFTCSSLSQLKVISQSGQNLPLIHSLQDTNITKKTKNTRPGATFYIPLRPGV